MTSDISDLLEQQGWQSKATLQRFKTFVFPPYVHFPAFALRLVNLDITTGIFMQVTPRESKRTVEVYLSYEPEDETKVKALLHQIEKVYIELISVDF